MLLRTIITLFLMASLSSCDKKSNNKTLTPKIIKTTSKQDSTNNTSIYTPHFFDYSNTVLENNIYKKVYAYFSNSTDKDCITLTIPKGKIAKTEASLIITDINGKIIYEHYFDTSAIIDSYATEKIKSNTEMINYFINTVNDFLEDAVVDTKDYAISDYLNLDSEAAIEDYVNHATPAELQSLDIFKEIKENKGFLLQYKLYEESNYLIGFSKKQGKYINISTCC